MKTKRMSVGFFIAIIIEYNKINGKYRNGTSNTG
jgi:hypothetical protein